MFCTHRFANLNIYSSYCVVDMQLDKAQYPLGLMGFFFGGGGGGGGVGSMMYLAN